METGGAVVALEALAQESRLGIFRLLVEAGPAGLPAGLIAERMKLPPPTLSFHLAQLKHSGLIGFKRDGRSLIYSANFVEMDDLIGFLTDNCCGGDAAQCAPAPRSKTKRERKSAGSRANRANAR
jgi:ArsR family transcriptional regulator, arsenate/arsenite/antimonite-responsive transcriptional repressor